MNLFEMTCLSSVLIIVVILLRALAMHYLPKKIFTLLWGVVLLRLLLPLRLASPFSIYTLITSNVVPLPAAADASSASSAAAVSAATKPLAGISVSSIVWAVGFGVCVLFFAASYWYSRYKFMTSLPLNDTDITIWLKEHHSVRHIQVRESDRITVPLTYGMIRPVILLPRRMGRHNKEVLHYILMHEYTHIRHNDAARKLLLAAALCLHWFNPLVWVMYVLFNRDIELSCDESVIHWSGISTKSAYALALIHMEEKKSGFLPLYSSFSKNSIEERIMNIMKMKNKSMSALVCGLFLAVIIITVFATTKVTPAENSETEDVSNSTEPKKDRPQQELRYEVIPLESQTDWTEIKQDAKNQGKSDEWINIYISELKKSRSQQEYLEDNSMSLNNTYYPVNEIIYDVKTDK